MSEIKMDKMQEDIGEIKVELAKISTTLENNTESLKEHIKRTELAEKRISNLEKISFISEGIWKAAIVVCSLILGLNSLGLLKKLF